MRTSSSHPLFARMYARLRPVMDKHGAEEHRARLLAGLSGQVVEVGAGDGGNFTHYPQSVTAVVAVEPEPYLRSHAARSAAAAVVPVEVVDGRAECLPVADSSVDAIERAGFVVEDVDRFDFPPDQPSPAKPHVLGRAIWPVP